MTGFARFADWQKWKDYYAVQLQHPADFEKLFVDKVLSQLHNVEPSDVIPQYHFKDSRGKNRYIDFVITNDAKGFSLAIELDGLTKIQAHDRSLDYGRYDDMMARQNDLLKLTDIGSLLRFTNKQAFNQTAWVINEINQELQKQAFNTACEREQKTHQVLMIQDYQKQIKQLTEANAYISEQADLVKQKSTDGHKQQVQIANMLAMLQTQMADLQAKIDGTEKQNDAVKPAQTMAQPVFSMNTKTIIKTNKPTALMMPRVSEEDALKWHALKDAEEEKARIARKKKLIICAVVGLIIAIGIGLMDSTSSYESYNSYDEHDYDNYDSSNTYYNNGGQYAGYASEPAPLVLSSPSTHVSTDTATDAQAVDADTPDTSLVEPIAIEEKQTQSVKPEVFDTSPDYHLYRMQSIKAEAKRLAEVENLADRANMRDAEIVITERGERVLDDEQQPDRHWE